MAKLILYAVVVTLICACVAQDFEPNPLEDPTTTTTDAPSTTKTTTTTTTTKKPHQQTTEKVAIDPSTDSPFPEKTTTTTAKPPKAETTVKPSTTTAKIPENPWKPVYPVDTTTTTTDKTIDTTTQASVKTTTTAKPSYYPWRPWYPGFPGHLENGNNHCYYKKQVGYPQMQWACGRLQYYTPIECYLCCQYQYSIFAGCNKVDNYHCGNGGNHINYNYKK